VRCPEEPTTEAEWRAIEEVDPDAVEDLKRRIVARVGRWEMDVPALVFLEATKPLSFIGSQALVVAEPLVSAVLHVPDYYTFRKMLENRANVEDLIERLEEAHDQRLTELAEERAERRSHRRGPVGWLRRLRRKGKASG